MNRRSKFLLIAVAVVAGLSIAAVIAGFAIVQGRWFYNFTRQKIISTIDDATGGRAELGGLMLDVRHLRARLDHLVIHGTEPQGDAPFIQVDSISIAARLFSGWHGLFGLDSLIVARPQVNIVTLPDGRTNIPAPRNSNSGNSSALRTVVDLAIKQFQIDQGSLQLSGRQSSFSGTGQNLKIALRFDFPNDRYEGNIAIDPLVFASANRSPALLTVNVPLLIERDRIRVSNATIQTRRSHLNIDGAIEDMKSALLTANLGGTVSLDELAGVTGIVPKGAVEGDLQLTGRARFASTSDYDVTAQIGAPDLSYHQGNVRILHARLDTTLQANAQRITVDTLRLIALRGQITAKGTLDQLTKLAFDARLDHFDIQTVLPAFSTLRVPYTGVLAASIHGVGDARAGLSGIETKAEITIAPLPGGIPVSGRVLGGYLGSRHSITISEAKITLPNSQVEAHGELGREADVEVVSRNLSDFAFGTQTLPVTFSAGGDATINARVTGPLMTPAVAAHLQMARFAVAQRRFDTLSADLDATASGATVRNANLKRNGLQAQFSGSVGLRQWSPDNDEPISLDASVRNGDLADLLALTGQAKIPATGLLNATAKLTGTIGEPQGNANLSVVNGTLYNDSFQSLATSVRLQDQLIEVPSLRLTAGSSTLDLSARYTHPRDRLSDGRLDAQASSSDFELAQLKTLQKLHPGLAGVLRLNASVTGQEREDSNGAAFLLSSVNANVQAHGVRDTRQNYGDLTLTAQTSGSDVNYRLDSNYAGSTVAVNGKTRLAPDYPTTAHASVNNLQIEKILALTGSSVPAQGTVTLTADLSGNQNDFRSTADFSVARGVVYGEPIDRVQGALTYTADSVAVSRLSISAPAGNVELSGTFSHAPRDFENGRADLEISSGDVNLARSRYVQKFRPGLSGAVKLTAAVSAAIRMNQGQRQVSFSKGDLTGSLTNLAMNQQALGDASLKATTREDQIAFEMQSSIGKADIRADGQMRLGADDPLQAKLTFKNVRYSGFSPLIGLSFNPSPGFDVLTEGQATVSGPALNLRALQGRLELARLEVSGSVPGSGAAAQTLALRNPQPIVITANQNQLRVESAGLTGASSRIALTGTAGFTRGAPMNLIVNGEFGLDLLQQIDRDIYSKGTVVLNATARGTPDAPELGGKLELKNVSLNIPQAPNGLSNAQGVILLNGKTASIQNLTGEVGGGKTTITGFVGLSGSAPTFQLTANAKGIRTRYAGASVLTDSSVSLAGTQDHSNLTGDVLIQQVTYAPESDLGSILTRAANPVSTSASPSALLSNMRLNIHIRTASGASFRTTLAQTLDATADLRLRGTADSPGMEGRITITRGELVFFGNQYNVNQGTIAFYDNTRIEPVLDVSLETKVQGVDVTLNISGAIDDLKLSYQSNPPLRFEEIVALLATGTTPSDPTIAANQPPAPTQGITQIGESALVTQAVANPLANRLQRVFGVSQLKIDPTFTTGSSLPQARVTLQQQVSQDITFSYTTNLTQTNDQSVRVEWAFSSRFSAVVTRDENGIVGLDFFYKKQLH